MNMDPRKFKVISWQAVLSGACSFLLFTALIVNTFAGSSDEAKRSVLKSEDNRSQVLLPASWKSDRSLNKDADLIAESDKGGLVMVIHADKKEMDVKSLKEFVGNLRESRPKDTKVGKITDTIPVKINGRAGLQFQSVVIVDNVPLTYIWTALETKDRYFVLALMSPSEVLKQNKSDMEKIIESFKVS